MKNFEEADLPASIMRSLARMEFIEPTPIQAQSIPLALEGRDILGSAQTGTGKTAAFGIPLITRLIEEPTGTALVLTPTRELAVQVIDMLQQIIGPKSPIKTALLIGGEPMPKQLKQLDQQPRLFVGTPGRINDHISRGTLSLRDTDFLVLDETDRMLDMGFADQLEDILRHLPEHRQTLMFSATLPQHIINLSKKYLYKPERISVGSSNTPVEKIDQEILHVSEMYKYNELLKQLEKREGSIIIFVKTKHGADRLAVKLNKKNLSAQAIHGDLRQSKRDSVLQDFRDKKNRILVATDVAARGLDIPHIEHVINYDLPQCPEDYIHRIGRTARADAEGSAVSLISPQDLINWQAIQYLLNKESGKKKRPQGRAGKSVYFKRR